MIVLALAQNETYFFENVNLSNIVSFGGRKAAIKSYSLIRNTLPRTVPLHRLLIQETALNNSLVELYVSYAEALHGTPLTISLDFQSLGYNIFTDTPPTVITMNVIPDNNQLAYVYTPKMYQIQSYVSMLCLAITAIAILTLVFSYFLGAKTYAIDILGMLQLSYLSMLSIGALNVMEIGLLPLRLSTGVNANTFGQQANQDMATSDSIKGVLLFSQFLQNVNFSALLFLLPLIVALATFLVTKLPLKLKSSTKKTLLKVFEQAIGEYTLMGLLFCSYLMNAAIVIELTFGVTALNIPSLLTTIVCIVLEAVYFLFVLFRPKQFGEFS